MKKRGNRVRDLTYAQPSGESRRVTKMHHNKLLWLLRGGTIPILCGGASCCFALYGYQVISAARQWRRLELPSAMDTALCRAHARDLDAHAGGCGVLTVMSAFITLEATRDYGFYRKASQAHTLTYLSSRVPFFVRPLVLASTIASGLACSQVGGLRLLAPQRPSLLAKGVR